MENNTDSMKENVEQEISPGLIFFSRIWKRKTLILSVSILSAIITTLYAFLAMDVYYKSKVNLVPPQGGESALEGTISSIGSALKQFGLGKLGGGAAEEGYSYMVILSSRTVADSIINKYNLAEVYDIPDSLKSLVRKAFSGNLDISLEEEGNFTLSIWDTDPVRARDMVNDYVTFANNLALKLSREESKFNLKYMEKRIKFVNDGLILVSDSLKSFTQKYGILSFEDQAKGVSDVLSELKAKEFTAETYLGMSKTMYGENAQETKMYENILKELKRSVANAKNKPGLAGNFSLKDGPSIGLEYARLFIDFETYSKVKAILLPVLEKAKLDVTKNVKNLYVVDEALVADRKDKPKRSLVILGAFVGTFAFMVLIILISDNLKDLKIKLKNISE